MDRADPPQECGLLAAAHDVEQSHPVLKADLVEHLAEVGGRGGTHQGGMAFPAHGLDHG
jgi:hypothetical protein